MDKRTIDEQIDHARRTIRVLQADIKARTIAGYNIIPWIIRLEEWRDELEKLTAERADSEETNHE